MAMVILPPLMVILLVALLLLPAVVLPLLIVGLPEAPQPLASDMLQASMFLVYMTTPLPQLLIELLLTST